EVTSALDAGHEHGARAVDLDGAVVGSERLAHVWLRLVLLERERPPLVRALVHLRVLALRDGDGAEVLLGLPGLDEEPAGPHRAVHEVGVVADGIAVLTAGTGELHRADARAGATVEG